MRRTNSASPLSLTKTVWITRTTQNLRELRHWPLSRWLIVVGVGLVYPVFLQTFGAILTRSDWWTVAAIVAISPLMGVWAASLFRSRAEMAVCDLKALCFGVCGIGIAVNQTATFDVTTSVVLSVAAAAGVSWGTWERLDKERVLNPLNDPEPGETCSTCVPLFPSRAN